MSSPPPASSSPPPASSSPPPPPRQEANLAAGTYDCWLTAPADGSTPQLFISQDSAVSYQNSHPNDGVLAVLGVSATDPYHQNIDDIYVIGETRYPIAGDQVYNPDNF
ncbi:hypothetical protein WJX74_004890 [Apatococcus lobatus]|uniref:Uncharacterized protein n=1 Tax=Apatococcus lobatus TaxID=904363 RepID=A0AAW1Q2B9_9CHLO